MVELNFNVHPVNHDKYALEAWAEDGLVDYIDNIEEKEIPEYKETMQRNWDSFCRDYTKNKED